MKCQLCSCEVELGPEDTFCGECGHPAAAHRPSSAPQRPTPTVTAPAKPRQASGSAAPKMPKPVRPTPPPVTAAPIATVSVKSSGHPLRWLAGILLLISVAGLATQAPRILTYLHEIIQRDKLASQPGAQIVPSGTRGVGDKVIAQKPVLNLEIFAAESAYLGSWGGYDDSGANLTSREEHLTWARRQPVEEVVKNLTTKYCLQFDRQAKFGDDSARQFYAKASARLAAYGIDLGDSGANLTDEGRHLEWAQRQTIPKLREAIEEKVHALMAGAAASQPETQTIHPDPSYNKSSGPIDVSKAAAPEQPPDLVPAPPDSPDSSLTASPSTPDQQLHVVPVPPDSPTPSPAAPSHAGYRKGLPIVAIMFSPPALPIVEYHTTQYNGWGGG